MLERMSAQAEKRDAYHHGDLRQALIDASVALIEEGGVQNLSLRKAAKRAGVSPAAPYHHFKNRAALMAAIATEGFRRLGAEMMSSNADEAGERLCQGGEAYIRFARENPAYFRVMFRPELADAEEFPELRQASQPVFEGLVQRVREAQGEGAIPSGDHERFVMLAWSMTHGLASLLVDGPLGAEDFDKVSIAPEDMSRVVVSALEQLFRDAAAYERG